MARLALILSLLCLGLYPQVVACGTPVAGGVRVHGPAGVKAAPRLTTRLVERAKYGDTDIGFKPGGEGYPAVGPTGFEVVAGGGVVVADHVHGTLVQVQSGRAKVLKAYPPAKGLPFDESTPGDLPVATAVSGQEFELTSVGEKVPITRVDMGRPLAGARVLGVDHSKRVFVLVETFEKLGEPAVQRTVLVFSVTGDLLGTSRIQFQQAAPVLREFFVTPAGELIHMRVGVEEVSFVALEMRP
jgi:hypothetical protein